MLKKDITFEDLEGKQVTERFYFGLNKAEVAEMELGAKGGSLAKVLQELIVEQDGQKIMDAFKRIISSSVGLKGDDGRRFVKSQEISDSFMQSDAYSELFVELLTNTTSAAEFINGIMPANLNTGQPVQDVVPAAGPLFGTDAQLAQPIDLSRAQATLASNRGAVPMMVVQDEVATMPAPAPAPLDLSKLSPDELQAAFDQLRQSQLGK